MNKTISAASFDVGKKIQAAISIDTPAEVGSEMTYAGKRWVVTTAGRKRTEIRTFPHYHRVVVWDVGLEEI